MGFFDRWFGGSKPAQESKPARRYSRPPESVDPVDHPPAASNPVADVPKPAPPARPNPNADPPKPDARKAGRQIPAAKRHELLREVVVVDRGDQVEVTFAFLLKIADENAEGWQTGVAIDASASMMGLYGKMFEQNLSKEKVEEYTKRGLGTLTMSDGHQRFVINDAGVKEAVEQGLLTYRPNLMQPVAREFLAYLADELDADGGTALAYWACGKGGKEIEEVGDFTSAQCANLDIIGPMKRSFGTGTSLLPAVRWFTGKFGKDTRALAVIITDGKIDDLEAVKGYSRTLAAEIEKKERAQVKFVLIGIGSQIDEQQMEELDDLDTGTSVDLWDHKIRKDMRDLTEIFAELVDELQIIATGAAIHAEDGSLIRDFSDGLPAKVTFTMAKTSKSFAITIDGQSIVQDITP